MASVFVGRTLAALATLWAASVVIFAVARLAPGSPENTLRGRNVDPRRIEELRALYGWDRPVVEQYLTSLRRAVTAGDLGISYQTQRPVAELLAQRLPATVELTVVAMTWAVVVGVVLGVVAACHHRRWPDLVAMTVSTAGLAVPVFFLGLLLLLIFSGMPIGSRLSPRLAVAADFEPQTGLLLLDTAVAGQWRLWRDAVWHLILPAAALGTIPAAVIARITGAAMLETLSADFVRTARAKGLSERRVVMAHALRTALIPIVTVGGVQLGNLLGGAVLTESVFSWPGLGLLLRDACISRDYPVLQGTALLVTAIYVTLNWAIDLSYHWLDPRVAT